MDNQKKSKKRLYEKVYKVYFSLAFIPQNVFYHQLRYT